MGGKRSIVSLSVTWFRAYLGHARYKSSLSISASVYYVFIRHASRQSAWSLPVRPVTALPRGSPAKTRPTRSADSKALTARTAEVRKLHPSAGSRRPDQAAAPAGMTAVLPGGAMWQRITASRASLRAQCSKQVHAATVHAPPTTQSRASWKVVQPGRVANLQLHTEAMPQLQPGQALVKVKAIGLNFADVFCCLGLYAAAPKDPYVPGLEFAGEVVEVCEGLPAEYSQSGSSQSSTNSSSANTTTTSSSGGSSSGSKEVPSSDHPITPGSRVMGVTRFGAYATHVVLDTRYLRPIPAAWSYAQAAAYPVQSITAMYALGELGAVQRGSMVLVQSAAGGVGLQALQIAKRMGASAVLGLVGSEGKVAFLRGMFANAADGPAASTAASAKGDGNCNVDAGDGSAGHAQAEGSSGHSTAATSSSSLSSSDNSTSSTRDGSCIMDFAVRPDSAAGLQQLLTSFLARHQLPGFDCVLDSVLGDAFQPCFDALAPCGRYVVFGAAALTPSPGVDLTRSWSLLWPTNWAAAAQLLWAWSRRPRVDVASLPGTNRSVCGFNLIWIYEKEALMAQLFGELLALQLPPPHVGHVFAFGEMVAALELLQSGGTVGKVVVEVDDAANGPLLDAK